MTAAQENITKASWLITNPLPPLADRCGRGAPAGEKVQHYLMLSTATAIASAATGELLVVQYCDPTSDHQLRSPRSSAVV